MEIDNTLSQQNQPTDASVPFASEEKNAPPSHIQLVPVKAEPGTDGYQPKPTIAPEDMIAPTAPAPLVNIKPEVAHLPPQDPSLDSTAIAEQKRLFAEKTAKIDARIASDMWDLDAWTALMNEAQSKDIRVARDIYERFLTQFPTAGRYWKVYAEHELLSGNYEQVDQIFNRSLLKCYNIDLWKFYVHYIKVTKDTQSENRADLNKAYEFALQHMGIDINSTQIWNEYLAFLKEGKTNGQYEEGQKITALRRIYQRAIENPMNNLENIWKEYDAFENDLNKILAKALINEKAPKYMAARSLYRERKRHYEGILRNMLARPPGYGGEKEANQVSLWKRLLEFEKTNPQKLEPPQLENRIVFTYNQCLLCLYHYPELWYDFAVYRLSCGALEAAIAVFERAIEAIPTSLILHFAYADMLESQKNVKAAKEVYEKLLTQQQTSMVFIHYMKFARRTEGMKEARVVFKRARIAPTISYHLFVTAALMEWHTNKETIVARNIFELGMTRFGSDPDYVIEYIKFLQHLNEENNLRVLFEKAVGQIPKEQCREIWNLYLQFECNYGDLNTIQKIENRKAKLYPELESTGIMTLVNRFKYGDLWPCDDNELESFEREPAPKVEEGKEEVVAVTTRLNVAMVDTSRFIRPDLNQLVLFNNEPQMISGLPTNIPEIISQFILSMPAPQTWTGPLVDVEQLLNLYNDSTLPPPPAGYEPLGAPSTDSKKRKVEDDDEEEDQPVSNINLPPSDDLFRKRQAAKLRQKKSVV